MKRNIVWRKLLIFALFSLSYVFNPSAYAQTCTVNSIADNNAGAGNVGTFAYCTEGAFNVINFSVPNGSVIPFRAVELNKAVTINGNPTVTLDGSGVYQKNPWNTNMITVVSNNIVINDLVLTNATGPAAFDGSGILVADGFSNITLNDVSISNSKNAGFATSPWVCGACGNTLGTSNITFNGGDYSDNGTSGIVVSNTDNLNISGTNFNNNGQHGLYMNGDTYVGGVYIPTTDLANAVGVTNSSILNVTSTNNGNGGITVAGNSTGNVIDGCTTNNNNEHGLWLRLASSNNTIQNCTSNNNGGGSLACGINISLGGNLNNNILNNSCAGNQDYGIYLYDNYGIPNDNNLIQGNTVTTSGIHGVYILNSTNTLVRNNDINNNTQDGINFGNSSSGGDITGNEVYCNGESGINITEGVLIPADGSDANTVNILPGGSNNNAINGNFVGRDAAGVICPNGLQGIRIYRSSGNEIGVISDNYTTGNTEHGILLQEVPAGGNVSIVNGAKIGTNDAGTAPLVPGNGRSGIYLLDCQGGVEITNSVISGNDEHGIVIENCADVLVEDNVIGTAINGITPIGNGMNGVYVYDGSGVIIQNNVIAANGEDGVHITNDATGVSVLNNLIGIGSDGNATAGLGNGESGIHMTGANANVIENNRIANNILDGIFVQSASSSTNIIRNNNVGILANGGDGGNLRDGIRLDQCITNTIESNNIGWNAGDGISLRGIGTNGNDLISNYIGIDNANNVKPNTGNGIYIASVATNNQIGNVGTGNFISGNGRNGIMVDGSSGNGIDGNIIGLNTTQTAVIPNGAAFSGIQLTGVGATGNVIGNLARNFIAGAHLQQILINAGANGNEVKNVDLGNAALGAVAQSTGNAILISGAGTDNNIVGGVLGVDQNNIFHSNNVAVLINAQATGNTVKSNVFEGVGGSSPISAIQITNGHDNIIGGGDATQGNVIKTTSADAIVVDGTSDGNQIQYNYIGVNEVEATQGPIAGHGILLSGAGVSNTIINENVIGNINNSANSGIHIDGVSAISTLYGNYIGINRGNVDIGNAGNGVTVLNSSTAVSVGTIGQNPNVISNNSGHGVELLNSNNSSVLNNHIGTNVLGTSDAGNTLNGVHVGAGNNGVTINENVIAGNTLDGILIDANVAGNTGIANNRINGNGINGINVTIGASTNLAISGNGIGVVTGNASTDGNTANGVLITSFSGTALIDNNIIGGNVNGIELNASSGVTIDGNHIGISDSDPAVNLANTNDGVNLNTGSSANVIQGNAIGLNADNGIELNASTGNTISGNFIGVNNKGSFANIGNVGNGISLLAGSNGNILSGSNIIGFNAIGVNISASTTNVLTDQFIGTNVAEDDLGNIGQGVYISGTSTGNVVDGASGTNFIAYNTTGVEVDGAAALTNTITENSTFCNDSKGITLTAGGNTGLEPTLSVLSPGIKLGVAAGSSTIELDTLTAPVGSVVEIFVKDIPCDNCDQGKTFVKSVTITAMTNGSGFNEFITTLPGVLTAGDCANYTITITDAAGNTSEFSTCSVCEGCNVPTTPIITSNPTFTDGDTIAICDNTLDVDLAVTDEAGFEFEWFSWDGTTKTSISAAAVSNITNTVAAPNTQASLGYIVQVTDPSDPLVCFDEDTVYVVHGEIPAPTITGNDEVCANTTGEGYSIASNTGVVKWTVDGDASIAGGQGTNSITVDFGTTTPINVTVNDSLYLTTSVQCETSDVLAVTVHALPDPTVTGVDELCANTTGEAYGVTATANTLLWGVNGTGNSVASGAGTNAITVDFGANSGQVFVEERLTLPSTAVCIGQDTLDVTIFANPNPTITGAANLCENETAEAYTSDALATNTIAWTTNGGLSVNGASNGVNVAVDIANASGDLMLSETFTMPGGGTCVEGDTITVTVVLLPVVEAGIAQNTCVDAAYTLDGSASVSAGTFAWTIEAAAGGALSNTNTLTPTYTPANPVDASKTFVLTLTATTTATGASCVATDVMNLTVNPLPTPTITGNAAPCENATPEVYQTSIVYAGYVWSNTFSATENNGTTNTTYSLGIPATGSGNVAVTVTDANNCTGSDVHAVSIITSSPPVFNQVTPAICETDGTVSGDLAATGISPGDESLYRFTWYRGTAPDESDLLSPTKNGDASADLNVADGEDVYLKAELISSTCPSVPGTATNAGPVVVNRAPDLTGVPMLAYCVNDNFIVEFTDASTGTIGYTPTYTWTLNGSSTSGSSLTKSHQIGSAGNNTYELTAVNGLCDDKATVSVLIKQPTVSASVSNAWIDKGASITVSANHGGSTEAYDYIWSTSPVGESGDGQTSRSFSSTPNGSTIYTVNSGLLDVADPSSPNCIATANVRVTVTSPPLPDEVFSPGNGDGVNDFWRIQFLNATDYPNNVVKVYNRWGNIVYEGKGYDYDGLTTTPETATEKWDGTRNGTLVPVATYYYVIELNDPDETLLSGAITIIR